MQPCESHRTKSFFRDSGIGLIVFSIILSKLLDNVPERDLRMSKVKQKVFGCFRSHTHASYFASIRGYVSTLKKNNQNVLENIKNVFLEKPFLPVGDE